jgi:hypothetical protein
MIRRAMSIKPLLALVVILAAALPTHAQGPFAPRSEPADKLVGEALDTPYATALLKTLAASVRKDGDPACLQAKALDDAALIARGRALWERYGVQMMKVLDENFDRAAFQAALSAGAGSKAAAEFERLERDPDVKKLIVVNRPARLAKVVDSIVENFDRFVLVGRIKLAPTHPVARGETELMKDNPTEAMRANPTEAAEAAVQQFLKRHASRKVDRYLDLVDAVETAMPKGYAKSALKLGPMAFFAGAERDLAELCVGRR